MKNKARSLSLLLLFVLAFAFLPLQTAYAKGIVEEGKLIFGNSFTLKTGETLDGDLVVFGGNVTIEEDAKVNGTVVVFGGNIESNGIIAKDVVAFGGNINLGESAVVDGDAVLFGGNLDADAKATIKGDTVKNTQAPVITLPNGKNPSEPTSPFVIDYGGNPLVKMFTTFGYAVAMAVLAVVISIFLQPQIDKVSQAVTTQPVMAAGYGLLAIFVVIVSFITILLIPIGIFGLVLAWFFGIIAMGQEVGERFTRAINKTWAPVLTVGLGTFLLVLASGFISIIPCVGGIAVVLLGLMAIGATTMTLFKSRGANATTPPAASTPEIAAGS